MKFLIKLLLISLISFLSGWLLGIHVAFAIYLLGSTIALLNYEKWRLNKMQIKQKYQLSKVVQVLEKYYMKKIRTYSYQRKIVFILLQIITITIQRFTNIF